MPSTTSVIIALVVCLFVGGIIFIWLSIFVFYPFFCKVYNNYYRARVHFELSNLDKIDIEKELKAKEVKYDPITGEMILLPGQCSPANIEPNCDSLKSDKKSSRRKSRISYSDNCRRKARIDLARKEMNEFQSAILASQKILSTQEKRDKGASIFQQRMMSSSASMGWQLSKDQLVGYSKDILATLYRRKHSDHFHVIDQENKQQYHDIYAKKTSDRVNDMALATDDRSMVSSYTFAVYS